MSKRLFLPCRMPVCRPRKRKFISPYHDKIRMRQATLPLRMLFTSFGFQSPIMREKFAAVIPQDETLRDKTCYVLPYAGFDMEKTFEREKQGLVDFGFSPDNIRFVRGREDIAFHFPDYIYVPGGDPFKLLKALREREILADVTACVRRKRAVYIGVSAGAYIAAPSIEYVKQLEDNNVIDDMCFGALGLIAESIVCHYDHYNPQTLRACGEFCRGPVLTINDDQLLLYEDGNQTYVGEEE